MDSLAETSFKFDYSPKIELAALASTRYKELEAMPAWADFISQLKTAREALTTQILVPDGTIDKHGKSHVKEKKAVLAFVNALLLHTVNIHSKAEMLFEEKRKSDEQKTRLAASQTGLLHGGDYIFDSDL